MILVEGSDRISSDVTSNDPVNSRRVQDPAQHADLIKMKIISKIQQVHCQVKHGIVTVLLLLMLEKGGIDKKTLHAIDCTYIIFSL